MTYKLLVLPGDGIGPEAMRQVYRVIDWLRTERHLSFEIEEDLVGGSAIDVHGIPVTDETIEKAKQADAVLLGAVGGPKWDDLPFEIKPERGLLRLRKDLNLFANLRPAVTFKALTAASSLKEELVSGLDIMIVRELVGGVYFGEPRGIETLENGERRGFNTQAYQTSEVERIAHIAFELAEKRGGKLTSSEKSNVMESGIVWRETVTEVAKNYPNVALEHMFADNACMQLVRNPKQFDVLVTDNLFGDILSDCAAMLTGSLGMLPSASLGEEKDGKRAAMYEPVHGSAPDIAGQNKANPLATLLSFTMALRYSFNEFESADLIESAVETVLNKGIRTPDIMAQGCTESSTEQMGSAVLAELKALNS